MAMNDNIVSLPSARRHDAGQEARRRRGPAKPSSFMINRQSAVPLHIQLKEQIRYAIMSGAYPPGSALPSIRDLTAELGIHRNTVHRVYLELQASGLLVSRAGKGVFVDEAWSDTVSAKELNAVDALIERSFQEAGGLGISPITLVKLAGQRAPAFDARHPVVAFVECTAHQSQECARDLRESFGVTVQHMLLDDLRANPKSLPASLKHIVTSVFHFDEVRALVKGPGRKSYPVAYDLHPATRKLLREIDPGRKLGFICHDANTEEVVGAQIQERVPPGVLIGCANLEAPELALALIKKADTVILTSAASAFCIKHCTPAHELLELHFALNAASVDAVARGILFQP
jgi:DNA-binding transcriptional regulator YhcF (GntR family)